MSAPRKSITKITGKSQNFFLTFKNCQSSFKILISPPLKLVFHTLGLLGARLEVAWCAFVGLLG